MVIGGVAVFGILMWWWNAGEVR